MTTRPPAKESATGPGGWHRLITCLGLVALTLAGAGCIPFRNAAPKTEVKTLQRQAVSPGAISPVVLQGMVMRLADEYAAFVSQAADDFAARVGTLEAKQAGVRIKLGQATAAYVNASGPSPVVNALDMVVLATISRMVAEDYLVGELFGDAAAPVVGVCRQLESNAWSVVEEVLRPDQRQELRDLIGEWRQKYPQQRYVGPVRFREFAEKMGKAISAAGARPNSVFSLLFLDPMAGLDPTVRAVEEARYLAERAMYYGQRMPQLLSWQAESLSLQITAQPGPQQVLTNLGQLTASLASFAKTAEQMPALITEQRQAGLDQIFAGLANERSNLLAGVVAEEAKARELLAQAKETFRTASEMAAAVQTAIQSLDAFVRYVAPARTNPEPAAVNPDRRPFDVLDYATAAEQINGMAKELNTLLAAVNQSSPRFAQLGQQASANADRVLWRAFWLGLVLIVVLLVGAVLAAVACRKLTRADQVRAESDSPLK